MPFVPPKKPSIWIKIIKKADLYGIGFFIMFFEESGKVKTLIFPVILKLFQV